MAFAAHGVSSSAAFHSPLVLNDPIPQSDYVQVASPAAQIEVRKHFPETWLWESISSDRLALMQFNKFSKF